MLRLIRPHSPLMKGATLLLLLLCANLSAAAAGESPPRSEAGPGTKAISGPPADLRGRFASFQTSSSAGRDLSFSPVRLEGGGTLTLISPQKWLSLAHSISLSLRSSYRRFTDLFGPVPSFDSSLRLIDSEAFFAATGAPRWTNALYFHKQIIIPLAAEEDLDFDNLLRSAKHEYAHAMVNSLSNGKCPGWLDEGLAQWAEGPENPALKPALAVYLTKHEPVPLKLLQGGFTKLEPGMVAAAYAQSLIAVHMLTASRGFERVKMYFEFLRKDIARDEAFRLAFGLTMERFEAALRLRLQGREWLGITPSQYARLQP